MKTFTTFALSLALCAAAGATAQTKTTASASATDTVLLSATTDGDYLIRRWIVKRQGDSDYSVRYRINLATLNATLDGNSQKLSELNAFVTGMTTDTLTKVKSVTITGYASPDGLMKTNEMLAKNRAMDFKKYVDSKYNFSKMYNVQVASKVEPWAACRPLVMQSQVPDKQAVLAIIDGQWTPAQAEAALKKMPAAWNYLAENILPSLRRVELTIAYREGNVVVERTKVPKAAPAPAPKPACDSCLVVDETITGLIVEIPEKEVRQEAKQINGDVRKIDKAAKREARLIEKQAKRDDRIAKKLAKEELRKANKIAKKEAKIAKTAEKMARKAAKQMGKM